LRWQPFENDAEDCNEREAKNEDWDAHPEEADARDQAVDPAAHFSCGEPTERDPNTKGKDECANCQLHRSREAREELSQEGLGVHDARAKITRQRVHQVADVLLPER
jgi:hypothetical protein